MVKDRKSTALSYIMEYISIDDTRRLDSYDLFRVNDECRALKCHYPKYYEIRIPSSELCDRWKLMSIEFSEQSTPIV